MSIGDTTVTVVGNLTADPELRYTPTGHAVAAFTVAATRRVLDRESGQWKDADTLFLRCSAWRQLGEHLAECLTRGTRVIVTGRLRQRDYETTGGEKHTVYELDAEDAGPSLRYATARVTKATRHRVPHPADTAENVGWGSPPATTGPTAAAGAAPAAVGGEDRPPF